MMTAMGCVFFTFACEEQPRVGSPQGDVDGDSDGDGDGDSDGDGDTDTDVDTDSEDCDNILEITVRDFDTTHPDMQRADKGWGPLAGVLQETLDADRKPIFSDPMGTHTWKTDQDPGVLVPNCWSTDADTEYDECYMGTIPMFEGEESFFDWYHDTELNIRFEKTLTLAEENAGTGVFVFDSSAFFPLSTSEGFGPTPNDDNPDGQNFLFTTEIHLLFKYVAGQKFTFRGDDDLWIFVNNKMALDIGGMHLPFEGTIDFDDRATALGISPGGSYHMDIFHAERHTSQSNFRIETNISCFIPVPIV
jgi:fibro-slime domain-containing protein